MYNNRRGGQRERTERGHRERRQREDIERGHRERTQREDIERWRSATMGAPTASMGYKEEDNSKTGSVDVLRPPVFGPSMALRKEGNQRACF